MNKIRRKQVEDVITEFYDLKSKLEMVLMEEEMVFNNMPENLQYSMRGQESEEAIEHMQAAVDLLGNAIEELEEI